MDIFAEDNKPAPILLEFSKINKAALGELSGAVVDKVASGDDSALETYIKAKALEFVVTEIISDVKAEALDEAEKYERDDSNILGVDFMVKNGATRYSFDHDDEWNEINDEIKKLTAKRKAREKIMIDATKYAQVVDENTGEIVTPAEVKSSGGSILNITIPKE
jgi:hypothetical protein